MTAEPMVGIVVAHLSRSCAPRDAVFPTTEAPERSTETSCGFPSVSVVAASNRIARRTRLSQSAWSEPPTICKHMGRMVKHHSTPLETNSYHQCWMQARRLRYKFTHEQDGRGTDEKNNKMLRLSTIPPRRAGVQSGACGHPRGSDRALDFR